MDIAVCAHRGYGGNENVLLRLSVHPVLHKQVVALQVLGQAGGVDAQVKVHEGAKLRGGNKSKSNEDCVRPMVAGA